MVTQRRKQADHTLGHAAANLGQRMLLSKRNAATAVEAAAHAYEQALLRQQSGHGQRRGELACHAIENDFDHGANSTLRRAA